MNNWQACEIYSIYWASIEIYNINWNSVNTHDKKTNVNSFENIVLPIGIDWFLFIKRQATKTQWESINFVWKTITSIRYLSKSMKGLYKAIRSNRKSRKFFRKWIAIHCPSAHLPICPCAHLSIRPSAHMSICPSAHRPPAHLPIYPSAHLPICPCAHLPICQSAHMPIGPSAHLPTAHQNQLKIYWIYLKIN